MADQILTHPTGPAQGMSEHMSAAETALMASTSGSMLPPVLSTWLHTCVCGKQAADGRDTV